MLKKYGYFILISYFFYNLAFSMPNIQLGIDQLFTPRYFPLIKGKKIALITNNASTNAAGKRDIDVFLHRKDIQLKAIFTPEHGLAVNKNAFINQEEVVDGIPIFSLYGEHHREPSITQLKNVDVIIYDLQSVGLRYYTYIATLAKAINTAKQYHKKILVLDHVNPLGSEKISGPHLDPVFIGKFTSYFDIPMRYGMTLGELAKYYNQYGHVQADLTVVPLKNWHRQLLFNQTHLKWTPTSPALQTFQQAYLYAIFGPLESTDLSFGFGGAVPQEYHYYGAPYISKNEAQRIVIHIQALHLPGLHFDYRSWRPSGGDYKGQWCHGIHVYISNYHTLNDFLSLVSVLKIFHQVLGDRYDLRGIDSMIGERWIRKAIMDDMPTEKILKQVNKEDADFMQKRQAILIYK